MDLKIIINFYFETLSIFKIKVTNLNFKCIAKYAKEHFHNTFKLGFFTYNILNPHFFFFTCHFSLATVYLFQEFANKFECFIRFIFVNPMACLWYNSDILFSHLREDIRKMLVLIHDRISANNCINVLKI